MRFTLEIDHNGKLTGYRDGREVCREKGAEPVHHSECVHTKSCSEFESPYVADRRQRSEIVEPAAKAAATAVPDPTAEYVCVPCGENFLKAADMARHVAEKHPAAPSPATATGAEAGTGKRGEPGDVWLYRVVTVGGGCEHELVSKSDELCCGNESWLTKQGCIQLDEHATLIRRASQPAPAAGFEVSDWQIEQWWKIANNSETYASARQAFRAALEAAAEHWSPVLAAAQKRAEEAEAALENADECCCSVWRECVEAALGLDSADGGDHDPDWAREEIVKALATARREAEEARDNAAAWEHAKTVAMDETVAHRKKWQEALAELDAARAEVEKLRAANEHLSEAGQSVAMENETLKEQLSTRLCSSCVDAMREQKQLATRPASLSDKDRTRLRHDVGEVLVQFGHAWQQTDQVPQAMVDEWADRALAVAERRLGGGPAERIVITESEAARLVAVLVLRLGGEVAVTEREAMAVDKSSLLLSRDFTSGDWHYRVKPAPEAGKDEDKGLRKRVANLLDGWGARCVDGAADIDRDELNAKAAEVIAAVRGEGGR